MTHEKSDVNFNNFGIRLWKKRIARFQNNVQNGMYPGHIWSLWLITSMVAALHFSGSTVPFDLPQKIMPFLPGTTFTWQVIACFLVALCYWLTIVFTLQYTLKLLLMYKGWMYETRGKGRTISLPTKLWVIFVRVFSGWNKPKLYSFQASLPRLPLPNIHDTTNRYLVSVRPLLDDKNYNRMVKLADEFENGIGKKLQRYLVLKSWWSSNYVSDWWEEYVYLRGRSPLMINSNVYGIDAILKETTNCQAARAATAIHSCLVFRRLIEQQKLKPIMIQGIVPLCSWQYERLFNTTRIPGMETDRIQHIADSNHIVVYHKGKYFKVIIYRGRILKPCEIQLQIQQILDDESEPLPGEEKLAALTAGDRTHWANTRHLFFSTGINRTSLDIIEQAAFVVTLDDFPFEYDKEDPSKLDKYGKCLLHGKGYDRWFDKTFTLCIGTNGRIGFNAEHSWADGPVPVHLWEHVILNELDIRYDEKGNTLGKPELTPPPPIRFNWDIKNECQRAIDTSLKVVDQLIADTDLCCYVHYDYGKGFMKKCGVSPDAYVQMVLQLAYYRDAGKFNLTYEASMTRLYREGRTETVRPCTMESCDWVRSMIDDRSTNAERIRLLRRACDRHQIAYQDAMCGKGIDRHLFCLYVVSKYLEVESPFLHEVLSEPWRLSTSQTPHGQTGMDLSNHPNCISAGGGFGPAADDGYGVSYIIAGEDMLFFHISNKKTSGQTDCHRFAKKIEEALNDMKQLYSENSS